MGSDTAAQPADPLAPDRPASELIPKHDRRTRRLRAGMSMFALAFFIVPLLAGAAVTGEHPIVGEPRATAPSPTQGWAAFTNATAYLAQKLPGRGRAIALNNAISERLFGSTPTYGGTGVDRALPFGGISGGAVASPGGGGTRATAFEGRDGWFFLQGDLTLSCTPPQPLDATVARWLGLISAIRASGRRVVWAIAPEKSTIYPEYLGSGGIDRECAQRGKQLLWSRLESLTDPAVITLRRPILATKRAAPVPVYQPPDSHWNALAAIEAVQPILDGVGSGLRVRPEDLHRGTTTRAGDLPPFLGRSVPAPEPTIAVKGTNDVRLPRSEISAPSGARFVVTEAPAGAAPVRRGTTLFIHDSYGLLPSAMLAPFFSRLIDAMWRRSRPSDLISLVRQADTVVLLTVERNVWTLGDGVVTAPFAARLRQQPKPASGTLGRRP
jgi:alginate O-acetyltransferase complex protein AlgJ